MINFECMIFDGYVFVDYIKYNFKINQMYINIETLDILCWSVVSQLFMPGGMFNWLTQLHSEYDS